jgi:pyruvate formate lyase activating enzyme
MKIGGFQKFSLSDFPGRISAILFTQGCNFRCPYCHNPELVDPARFGEPLPLEGVLEFLGSRKGRLQGVVVTGGEPTIHSDLPMTLMEIKAMGFAVKLDTNGGNPELLERILARDLVDYVAMDLKAPLEAYPRVAGVAVRTEDIQRSLEAVKRSGIPHELRTTFVDGMLTDEDMLGIARLADGCERLALQRFHPTKILDKGLHRGRVPSHQRMSEVQRMLEATGLDVVVR